MSRNRMAYACDTPLQVLNAINMQVNQCANCESDIFIYNQFNDAEKIAKRLKETAIFRNVYLVKKYKEYSKHFQKAVTLLRILFPYLTIRKHIENEIKREKYQSVVFSFVTTFSITVFGMSGATQFIQLEDGIGTYVGDILNDYTSKKFKKIASISKYKCIFNPQKIVLYNLDMYQGQVPAIKLETNFSSEVSKQIEFVYGYLTNDLYRKTKCIYLSQPIQNVEGYNAKNNEQINQIINYYKKEVIIRIHPREQKDCYKDFQVDSIRNLWELECIHQIDDDSILVSGFSTAQLMPKILKDKEPYVVLLYKLIIENVNNEYWTEISSFMEKFKSFYRNPEKIFVPETIEELEVIIHDILKAGKEYE